MKISNVGSNMTQLTIDGAVVLFSYETPVAACIDGEYVRTSKKWSVTTSRHINKWLNGVVAREVSQDHLDGVIA